MPGFHLMGKMLVLGGLFLAALPARGANWYIGHAGYAGPEASDPNFRNYDAGSFNLETFLSTTIAAGDRVVFVDASAPYQKASHFIAPQTNVTLEGTTNGTVIFRSDGANNNSSSGQPRSAFAVQTAQGLQLKNLTFEARSGDQAALVLWAGSISLENCHIDSVPGFNFTAGFLTVSNGATANFTDCLLEAQFGETIGFWQPAQTPAGEVNLTGCEVRGGTFATNTPTPSIFNVGCISYAGNMMIQDTLFIGGESHIPVNIFAYVNGATRTFDHCIFKLTVSDSLANSNGGAYAILMSFATEPLPTQISQEIIVRNCDFIGTGAGSLAAVRSIWRSELTRFEIEKCIFHNFLYDIGFGPNGFAMWADPEPGELEVHHNVVQEVPYFYFNIADDVTDIHLEPEDPLYVDLGALDLRLESDSLAALIDPTGDPVYAGSQGPVSSGELSVAHEWTMYQ